MIKALAIAGIALTFIMMADVINAATQNDVMVGRIGVQGNKAYIDIDQPLNEPCKWGILYLDLTTIGGELSFTQIMKSKEWGSPLSRVDYTYTDTCYITLVEIDPVIEITDPNEYLPKDVRLSPFMPDEKFVATNCAPGSWQYKYQFKYSNNLWSGEQGGGLMDSYCTSPVIHETADMRWWMIHLDSGYTTAKVTILSNLVGW